MIPTRKNVSDDRPLMDQCCPSVHLSVSQPVGVFTGPPAVNHQSLSPSPSQNAHALWPGLLDQRLTPGLHTWTGASRPRWSWIQLVQLCLSVLSPVFGLTQPRKSPRWALNLVICGANKCVSEQEPRETLFMEL